MTALAYYDANGDILALSTDTDFSILSISNQNPVDCLQIDTADLLGLPISAWMVVNGALEQKP
jgi:hypothetical protein